MNFLRKGTAVQLLLPLPGMEDFDSSKECLKLLKPGSLWNLALARVLAKAGMRPVSTDNQLNVKHSSEGALQVLLSVHVDDLKATGLQKEIELVLETLSWEFDQLKLPHLGIRHETRKRKSRIEPGPLRV